MERHTILKEDFPKPLRRAILSYARAVRSVVKLGQIPEPDPLTYGHVMTFLPEMESILVDQLVTEVSDFEEINAILSAADLEYLSYQVSALMDELGERE